MSLVFLILSLVILVPQTKATIDGVVVSALNGQPVSGAQVTLIAFPGAGVMGVTGGVLGGIFTTSPIGTVGQAPPVPTTVTRVNEPTAIPPTTTGNDGRFSFKDLDAGNYRISVVANGFARQEY